MTELHDCSDPETRSEHLEEAAATLRDGGLVVFPTDTVYGVGADAFTPEAVMSLLAAKGRGRHKPPPVLINDAMTMDALAVNVSQEARALAQEFWPGPLTMIFQAQSSLMWDLGDTQGTVALRVPDNEIALDLLRLTGPLAVSSANRTGMDPAITCEQASEQLGEAVQVYLDGGQTTGQIPSTILDCTGATPIILREGALSREDLARVAPSFADREDDSPDLPEEEAGAE